MQARYAQLRHPVEVARVILDCLTGPLKYTSGDAIWVHKTV